MTTLDLHNAAIARLEAELAAADVRERQKAQSYTQLVGLYREMTADAAALRKALRDLWRLGRIDAGWRPMSPIVDVDTLMRLMEGPPTTTTSPFALVPIEDERAAVICDLAAARLRRQSIGNAAAEIVARAAIDAERETRTGDL